MFCKKNFKIKGISIETHFPHSTPRRFTPPTTSVILNRVR